jgi:hypothetical protein
VEPLLDGSSIFIEDAGPEQSNNYSYLDQPPVSAIKIRVPIPILLLGVF